MTTRSAVVDWTKAVGLVRCNFHPVLPAVLTYFGTPLCQHCATRAAANEGAAANATRLDVGEAG